VERRGDAQLQQARGLARIEPGPVQKLTPRPSGKSLAQAVGLLGFGLIAACHNVNLGDNDYPLQNPAPTKLLLIHGTIDASLDIKFRIRWRAENPHCRYAASWIEGAFAPYTAWSTLAIARQGDKFSARVPIDGVLPGRCQWGFAGVKFGGPTGFATELVATNSYPLRPGQSANGVAALRCKWKTEPGSVEGERGIRCTWPDDEDRNASVSGGVLWWHPDASDLEVHFIAD
jgi:hypothetical protein